MILTWYVETVWRTLVYFLPAMVANGAPLVASRILRRRRPVDFGKVFFDGRRIFGDSKSWEGLVIGVLAGGLVGVLYLNVFGNSCWLVYGLVQGLGAMLGDLGNSFLKRRLGISPGKPFPPFDQITFILGAYLLSALSGVNRLVEVEVDPWVLLVALLMVLMLHPLTNLIAYKLGLKPVPW